MAWSLSIFSGGVGLHQVKDVSGLPHDDSRKIHHCERTLHRAHRRTWHRGPTYHRLPPFQRKKPQSGVRLYLALGLLIDALICPDVPAFFQAQNLGFSRPLSAGMPPDCLSTGPGGLDPSPLEREATHIVEKHPYNSTRWPPCQVRNKAIEATRAAPRLHHVCTTLAPCLHHTCTMPKNRAPRPHHARTTPAPCNLAPQNLRFGLLAKNTIYRELSSHYPLYLVFCHFRDFATLLENDSIWE